MLPFVYSFITYKDVFGVKAPSIDETIKYFSSLHTGHFIQALCKLNIALWKGTNDFRIHNDLLKVYFNEEELEKIYKYRLKNKHMYPFVFHRQQILIAIKLVLLHPNKQGEKQIDLKCIGKYILGINDYLDHNHQPPAIAELINVNYETNNG